jgi:hypothetical protein
LIHLVPLNEVDRVWPLLSEGLVEACRRGGDDLTAFDMLAQCRTGKAMLFVALADEEVKAGMVVRPELWGDRQVLRILALTGWGMDVWLPWLLGWDWPKQVGIKTVIFEGREGWKRMVPNARVLRTVYEVDVP